jgi:hypothetical protein
MQGRSQLAMGVLHEPRCPHRRSGDASLLRVGANGAQIATKMTVQTRRHSRRRVLLNVRPLFPHHTTC